MQRFLFLKPSKLFDFIIEWRWIVFLFGSLGVMGNPNSVNGASPHPDVFLESMKQLEIPAGYDISLFAAEPDALNPIALSVDEAGRVYLAETDRYRDAVFDVVTQKPEWLPEDLSFRTVEDRTKFLKNIFKDQLEPLTRGSERIRVLEDFDGDGVADTSFVLADGFSTIPTGPAAGILAYRGKVWFQCLPGLWRVDWIPESRQRYGLRQLHEGFGVHVGVSGHDLHGITWGPEGRLYFSMGDRGLNVETSGGVLSFPDTGAILRCEPDGTNLEIVAYGLRNPQEIVFDPYGNLFAGDNDTSGADQSRILHILPHGDYGWRCSYQHMKGFGPWVKEEFWKGGVDDVLPSVGYVSQGPSGFTMHPEAGANPGVPGPFFICDFPGGIRSFQMEPSGSSFVASNNQKWLWNLWSTDLTFGPDGSVYVADWVAGWQQPEKGRVYRIRGDGEHVGLLGADVRPLLEFISKETNPEQLAAWLAHENQWVRREAQFRLVELGEVSSRVFIRTLSTNPSLLARLHAVWGLSQLTRKGGIAEKTYYQSAALLGLKDRRSEVRRATLEWLSDVPAQGLLENVIHSLHDPDDLVVQQAALTLGEWMPLVADSVEIENEPLMDTIVGKLENLPLNGVAHTRHAYHYLLSQWIHHAQPNESALNRLSDHNVAGLRMAMLQAFRRIKHKSVALFLEDDHEGIRTSAVRAIYDGRIDEALPQLVEWIPHEQEGMDVIRRWIWAHFYMGKPHYFEKLIALLDPNTTQSDNSLPPLTPEARRECFEVLSHWGKGTDLDPITGLWRPFQPQSFRLLKDALKTKWGKIFEHEPVENLLPIVYWLAQEGVQSAAPQLEYLARNENVEPILRSAAIKALFQLQPDQRDEWLRLGLESGVDSMRAAALSKLTQGDAKQLLPLLVNWFESEGSVTLRQSIVVAVSRWDHSEAQQIFESWWNTFLEGGFPSELQLELLDGVRSSDLPVRLGWWRSYRESFESPSVIHVPSELLSGGNATRGREIFRDRVEVACMRCHKTEGEGGVVGPDLDRVSERLTPSQILESILYPNEAVTPGYASERFLLKDGEDVSGIVVKETDQQITLRQSDGSLVQVWVVDIDQRVPSLSPMPEGVAAALKSHELRDLMAYLLSRSSTNNQD